MDFMGPSATDYDNVTSLNRAFLALLGRDAEIRRCLEGLRPPLADRLASLTAVQAERLATTPFLLMSFRERDDRFWEAAFAPGVSGDLFGGRSPASDECSRLVSAGLGFAWQLTKQNPYAARLICGASLHWCEQLAELTFLHLLAVAGLRTEVLTLRCATENELWTKLLQSGISREQQVRRAAHISALQSVLTRASMGAAAPLRAAACAAKSPSLRVADETG
jgi:hypothetical protein